MFRTPLGLKLLAAAVGVPKLIWRRLRFESDRRRFRSISEGGGPQSSLGAGNLEPKERIEDVVRARRKMAMLERLGLFGKKTNGAVIARACSFEDLKQAYRLVHDAYTRTGYIKPQRSGLRLRMFEAIPETATFVAKVNEEVVGVLSIVHDSPELGLPSDAAFQLELDQLRASGAQICEATNQVVREEFRNTGVATELMRCAVAHITVAGYDEVVAVVSPSHQAFYGLLNFRGIGSERSYSAEIEDRVVALTMDINRYRRPACGHESAERFVHAFFASQNHFLEYVRAWSLEAAQSFRNPHLLQSLFAAETKFIDLCKGRELRVLRRHWGSGLYRQVTGYSFVMSLQERLTGLVCKLDTMQFQWGVPVSRRSFAR